MRQLMGVLMPVGPFLGAGWVGGNPAPFRWGFVSFLLSQAVHIPLVVALAPLFQGWGLLVMLCFLAGLCEEPARLAVMRWRLPRLSAREAAMFGCGHAACEAILLGLFLFLTSGPWTWWAVVERFTATALHVAASLRVWRGDLKGAILLHGVVNLLVVGTVVLYGVAPGELLGLTLAMGLLAYVRSELAS